MSQQNKTHFNCEKKTLTCKTGSLGNGLTPILKKLFCFRKGFGILKFKCVEKRKAQILLDTCKVYVDMCALPLDITGPAKLVEELLTFPYRIYVYSFLHSFNFHNYCADRYVFIDCVCKLIFS